MSNNGVEGYNPIDDDRRIKALRGAFERRQQQLDEIRQLIVGLNLNANNRQLAVDRVRPDGVAQGPPVNTIQNHDRDQNHGIARGCLNMSGDRKNSSRWKLFNGRFTKHEFVDWLLEIEKYFYYSKVSKVEGVKLIYDALTPRVRLWWDDFQRDRHSFGFPPINTCGLMVYLLIEEYYFDDCDEIMSRMNQLFYCVYDDYEEEVQVESIKSFVEVELKKEVDTPTIESMKFSVSPVMYIDVRCVNIDDIPKFVKDLKSLYELVDDEGNSDILNFQCCEDEICATPTCYSWNYDEPDVAAQDFLGIENYFRPKDILI